MERNFEQQEKNTGVFSFSFTKEEFKEAMNWAFKRNAKRFNVPGFRKGKAPMPVVMNYYGEAVLYDDAVDHIIAPAYAEAVKEFNVSPVSQPSLDITEIGTAKGFVCTLTVDTEPIPELGEYLGLEAEKPEVKVDEEAVERELKRIQDRNARLVPVEDRAAEMGDTANIDFEGFLGDEAFDGGKGENHDLELGSGSFIPGFEEQVAGHNVDEEFDVKVTFPEDYGAEELAGQEAVFKVKINSLKRKELPELNDDFAMDVSEFDTLDEYKDSLRNNLLSEAEARADRSFEQNLLDKVVENASVDIPHSMIHNHMDQMLRYQRQQMRYQGIELEQYLQFIGQTLDQYMMTLHEPAERQLKISLVLKAIAEKEGISLTDEEKDEEIKTLAKQTGLAEDEVRRQIGDNEAFFEGARDQKTIRFLKDKAKPVPPAEKKEEDEPEAEDSEA